ncbi:MAG: zinc metallopeptidase [Clostridia bacterium]|nr:zinc metallopeptidase [Clostridia bacterium]
MPAYGSYYYGFDIYYLILILPAVLITLWAQVKVKSTFNKYSKVASARGLTAQQAVQRVLSANGVNGVTIQRVSGDLTDHYDPKSNVIRLSDTVYSSTSIAAIGVAAHEAGHAVQHAVGYGPIKLRNAIIPVCNIGSQLAWPLLLIGLLLDFAGLITVGIALYSLATVFQLITLPVEFNASRRAIRALDDSGMLDDNELPGARRTLSAAAMTYVAALLMSAAQLLRLVLLFGGRNRRD